jgi:hypothetical protein
MVWNLAENASGEKWLAWNTLHKKGQWHQNESQEWVLRCCRQLKAVLLKLLLWYFICENQKGPSVLTLSRRFCWFIMVKGGSMEHSIWILARVYLGQLWRF